MPQSIIEYPKSLAEDMTTFSKASSSIALLYESPSGALKFMIILILLRWATAIIALVRGSRKGGAEKGPAT